MLLGTIVQYLFGLTIRGPIRSRSPDVADVQPPVIQFQCDSNILLAAFGDWRQAAGRGRVWGMDVTCGKIE